MSPNNNPPSEARGLSMSIAKPMEVELTWILFKELNTKALQTVNFRFLNFQETPFQA